MKPLYTCFTLILLILFTLQVSAQNMNAVNSMLNRQSMQFSMQMQQNMMMQMSMLNGNNNFNSTCDYLVIMNDSSKIVVRSKIYSDTAKHKTYLIFVDKKYSRKDTANRNKKIYVSQTQSIARYMGTRGSKEDWYKGIPVDSCWMFKTMSGSINAYSVFSQPDSFGYIAPPLMAIQKGDGPIVKLTPENLKPMVGQDADALENIQKKDYYKAIKKYNRNAEKAAKK